MAGNVMIMQLRGGREVEAALHELPRLIAERTARKAIVAAAQPIIAAARDNLYKNRSVETGELYRSLGVATKQYKRGHGGSMVGIIGARNVKNTETGRNPAKYAHLVEFGHVVLQTAASGALRKYLRKKGTTLHAENPALQFVPAKPFLRPAFEAKKHQAVAIILKSIKDAIERYKAKKSGNAG